MNKTLFFLDSDYSHSVVVSFRNKMFFLQCKISLNFYLNVLLGTNQRLFMVCFPYVLNFKNQFSACICISTYRYFPFIFLFSLQYKLSIRIVT